jgi:hypothetical protein
MSAPPPPSDFAEFMNNVCATSASAMSNTDLTNHTMCEFINTFIIPFAKKKGIPVPDGLLQQFDDECIDDDCDCDD